MLSALWFQLVKSESLLFSFFKGRWVENPLGYSFDFYFVFLLWFLSICFWILPINYLNFCLFSTVFYSFNTHSICIFSYLILNFKVKVRFSFSNPFILYWIYLFPFGTLIICGMPFCPRPPPLRCRLRCVQATAVFCRQLLLPDRRRSGCRSSRSPGCSAPPSPRGASCSSDGSSEELPADTQTPKQSIIDPAGARPSGTGRLPSSETKKISSSSSFSACFHDRLMQ